MVEVKFGNSWIQTKQLMKVFGVAFDAKFSWKPVMAEIVSEQF